MNPNSLFGLSDHLESLSKDGDPLEVLDATVDFEANTLIGVATEAVAGGAGDVIGRVRMNASF